VLTADPGNRVPHLAFQPDALEEIPILAMDAIETAYYLRLCAVDRPGVLAEVTRILGDQGISIEAILQKEPFPGAAPERVPVILLTHPVQEGRMNRAIQRIEALDSICDRVVRLRVEYLDVD